MKIQKHIFLYCLIPLFTIILLNGCSDDDDPMLILHQENRRLQQEEREREAFVEGARCMQAARSVVTDLERTRMYHEDLCARLYRH